MFYLVLHCRVLAADTRFQYEPANHSSAANISETREWALATAEDCVASLDAAGRGCHAWRRIETVESLSRSRANDLFRATLLTQCPSVSTHNRVASRSGDGRPGPNCFEELRRDRCCRKGPRGKFSARGLGPAFQSHGRSRCSPLLCSGPAQVKHFVGGDRTHSHRGLWSLRSLEASKGSGFPASWLTTVLQ